MFAWAYINYKGSFKRGIFFMRSVTPYAASATAKAQTEEHAGRAQQRSAQGGHKRGNTSRLPSSLDAFRQHLCNVKSRAAAHKRERKQREKV